MFKSLIHVYREQAVTQSLVNEFLGMVGNARQMYLYSYESLKNADIDNEAAEKIYHTDQTINLAEREIRKRILVHLKTVPECNLPAHLVLVSIIKDAERLGDYVKNCYELRTILKDTDKDRQVLCEIYDNFANDILNLFDNTIKAMRDSDKAIAMTIMTEGRNVSNKCQYLIERSVEANTKTRYVVITVLAARYFKRIALHLSNIASSVVNPLPEVDYMS